MKLTGNKKESKVSCKIPYKFMEKFSQLQFNDGNYDEFIAENDGKMSKRFTDLNTWAQSIEAYKSSEAFQQKATGLSADINNSATQVKFKYRKLQFNQNELKSPSQEAHETRITAKKRKLQLEQQLQQQ